VDPQETIAGTYKAESPHFRLEIVASPDEIDELNRVSNLVYLRWVLRAAQAHSEAVGYGYHAYQKLGAVFVVRRHEIDYLKPAFAGDRIALSTWIETWRPASVVRRTSVLRVDDGVELARASTRWALVGAETGRPQRVPEELKQAFRKPPQGDAVP
jgi:acyl-CoA thioester hydrolase